MLLSDKQWKIFEPMLAIERKSNMGRPPAATREVFEALLFVLYTGIQWRFLPRTFPPKSTVHDYLKIWSQRDAFRKILAHIVRQLAKSGRLQLDECHIDATFVRARGGGEGIGLTRHGKGAKTQLIVDKQGIPIGVSQAAADQGETSMMQQTLGFIEEELKPERLIGDKAYDSDPLDEVLAELGIDMISPHRKNRLPENHTQDGRSLRRYKRRWHVERTIAWLGNHRRLLIRWEKQASLFMAFTLLGCVLIASRFI
jgi:transposase